MHDWTGVIAHRLSSAGHVVADDVLEELAQHAAAAYESARAEGLDPDAARAKVEGLIIEWTAAAAYLRHPGGGRPSPVPPPESGRSRLAGLWHDARYAWRVAWRKPAPTIVAAITMALGIGATASLFSVTWNVLMKPLPWADPDSLIRMRETREGATRTYPAALTNSSYLAWASNPQTIEGLAGYSPGTGAAVSAPGAFRGPAAPRQPACDLRAGGIRTAPRCRGPAGRAGRCRRGVRDEGRRRGWASVGCGRLN